LKASDLFPAPEGNLPRTFGGFAREFEGQLFGEESFPVWVILQSGILSFQNFPSSKIQIVQLRIGIRGKFWRKWVHL